MAGNLGRVSRPTGPAAVAENRSLLARVVEAAAAVEVGDPDGARRRIEAIGRACAAGDGPGPRLARLFASALLARLTGGGAGSGNLYGSTHGPADMLAAFEVLLRRTPFVNFGHATVNAILAGALAGAERIHLIDLGIGSGIQWPGFLDALARQGRAKPRVRLTGIDIPAPGADPGRELHRVGAMLRHHAAQAGLPFAYTPLACPIEQLDFDRLRAHPGEVVAVNAAFALHHVLPDEASPGAAASRGVILRGIRALDPAVLTLVEPDVAHNARGFIQRVRASFDHYLAVFDALATLLPSAPREREVIEQAFFGREIRNIVANEGAERVERHERHAAWRRRLLAAGFAPLDPAAMGVEVAAPDLLHGMGALAITRSQEALSLAWKGTPLIAASAWRARVA